MGKDKQDIEELCQLTFYNGLRAEARQWFDGLAIETQEDWGLLKKEFTKKFDLADTDKQMVEIGDRLQELSIADPAQEGYEAAEDRAEVLKDRGRHGLRIR